METLPMGVSYVLMIFSPHSLGTLIEWKQMQLLIHQLDEINRPHSLGTLIEWKRSRNI